MGSVREEERDLLYGCLRESESKICMGLCSLMSGVWLAIVLDLLVAVFAMYRAIQPKEEAMIVQEWLQNAPAIIAVVFVAFGIQALRFKNPKKMHVYSLFKQIELPVLLLLTYYLGFQYCEELKIGCDERVILFIIPLERSAVNLYFTHIVWSADMKMARNEFDLIDIPSDLRAQLNAPGEQEFVPIGPDGRPPQQ